MCVSVCACVYMCMWCCMCACVRMCACVHAKVNSQPKSHNNTLSVQCQYLLWYEKQQFHLFRSQLKQTIQKLIVWDKYLASSKMNKLNTNSDHVDIYSIIMQTSIDHHTSQLLFTKILSIFNLPIKFYNTSCLLFSFPMHSCQVL